MLILRSFDRIIYNKPFRSISLLPTLKLSLISVLLSDHEVVDVAGERGAAEVEPHLVEGVEVADAHPLDARLRVVPPVAEMKRNEIFYDSLLHFSLATELLA